MKRWLFPIITIVLALFVSCEKNNRLINVSGEGAITFVPDMVTLSITVKNINPRLVDSIKQTKETVNNLLDVCKRYSISDVDIKSSLISTDKEYHEVYNQEPKFIGYSATQTTQVTFRELDKFEQFSGDIFLLKVTSVNNMVFNHSKKNEYSSEADLLALDNAKEAAGKLADRMHVKLGKVVYISNTNESPEYPSARFYGETFSKSMNSGVTISPGLLTVTRNVNVVFEIE